MVRFSWLADLFDALRGLRYRPEEGHPITGQTHIPRKRSGHTTQRSTTTTAMTTAVVLCGVSVLVLMSACECCECVGVTRVVGPMRISMR